MKQLILTRAEAAVIAEQIIKQLSFGANISIKIELPKLK